jgi:serine/threonine protein kinase
VNRSQMNYGYQHQDAGVASRPFGRYRLVELLGRGGMGEVWRAYDTGINNRIVAIKLLPPHLADDSTFAQRFRREADMAAQLNNQHVIPIHTYGEIDGRLYVDMRLIEGRDLAEALTEGSLEPGRAVRIVEQVAKALDAAHKVGLLHRDVKPSNILLTEDDFAYLIDFGIARAAGETKLTDTGALVGTLAYMAPERFTTDPADSRADIYSLACVLHECLTGTQPFPGDSAAQQMTADLTLDPPRPSSRNPAIPSAFDEVIVCGMAKQPAKRFSSAGELASAANAAAAASSHSPNDHSPRKPRVTRRFSTLRPNQDGTGDTRYPEQLRVSEPAKRKLGRGPLVLVAAAALTFLAAALIAALLILRENRGSPNGSGVTPAPTRSTSEMTTASPTAGLSSTAKQPLSSLSGTDAQGFVGYPAARCNPGNTPAVINAENVRPRCSTREPLTPNSARTQQLPSSLQPLSWRRSSMKWSWTLSTNDRLRA